VFGSTGGIGSELCRKLLAPATSGISRTVVLAGRDEEKLQNLSNELGSDCSSYHVVDALDGKSVDQVVDQVIKTHGRLHGVANAIGSIVLKPAHTTSEKEFDDTMKRNTYTSFNILKSSVKHMGKTGGGSIAFCASAVALHGIQNHEAIAAAKGAIVAMAKSAASTYAPKNIRINCVAPGLIATPMTEKITKSEGALRASEAMHALGRIGQPKDVAAALAFFLNPENDFITGQVLGVDGGLSSVRAS